MLSIRGYTVGEHNANMKNDKRYARILQKLISKPGLFDKLFSTREWEEHHDIDSPTESRSQEMYHRIARSIAEHKQIREERAYRKIYRINQAFKYSAAAILIIGGFWMLQYKHAATGQHVIIAKDKSELSPLYTERSNNKHNIQKLILPDSSEVKLYPGSTIRYLRKFAARSRDITLRGKAYFHVSKDQERPFSVVAGGLRTTAIGTSFTINSAAGKNTLVKLHSGKIVVRLEDESRHLASVYLSKPGNTVLFNPEANILKTLTKKKTINELAARRMLRSGNIISIENMPLSDVIKTLSEAYQVEILADVKTIQNITYTGEVDLEHEGIRKVLDVICLINNLEIEQQNENTFHILKSK